MERLVFFMRGCHKVIMEDIGHIFPWLWDNFQKIIVCVGSLFSPAFWMHLLQEYKYWIVILGALVEGEMILIIAGAAAYYGCMHIHMVILIAFLGALLHDNALFFLGRLIGQNFLQKHPKIYSKVEKVTVYILRYNTYFILGFRFVYGIRTLTPFVIGTSHIKFFRYTSLVSISAFVWAAMVGYFGYSSALAIEALIADFNRYKSYLGAFVIVLVGAIVAILQRRRKLHLRREEENNATGKS